MHASCIPLVDPTAATSCSLTFGKSATTSSGVYRGCVFLVTSLRRDKLVADVMDRLFVDEDISSQSQGQLYHRVFVKFHLMYTCTYENAKQVSKAFELLIIKT